MKAAVVIIAMLLAGCAAPRPEPVVEIVERKVEVPASLLSCMPVKLESVKILLAQ